MFDYGTGGGVCAALQFPAAQSMIGIFFPLEPVTEVALSPVEASHTNSTKVLHNGLTLSDQLHQLSFHHIVQHTGKIL